MWEWTVIQNMWVVQREQPKGKSFLCFLVILLTRVIRPLALASRSLTSVVAHFALFVFVVVLTPMKTGHPMVLAVFGALIFVISSIRILMAKKVPKGFDLAPRTWVNRCVHTQLQLTIRPERAR